MHYSGLGEFRSLILQKHADLRTSLSYMLQNLVTDLLVNHPILFNDLVELFVNRLFIAPKLTPTLRTPVLLLLNYVFGSAHGAVAMLSLTYFTPQGSIVEAFWSKQMQHYFYSSSPPFAV